MHGKTYIENEKIRVEVDPLTGILTVTYRDLGTITCRLEIENEVGSVYSHRDITRELAGLVAAEGLKSSNKPVFNVTNIKVLEGPLSQRLIVEEELYGCFWPYRLHDHYGTELYRYKLMDIRKEIRIFKDIPWVEVKLKLKNDFPHIRLRWRFDLNFKGRYMASTPFGAIERKPEPREYPMECWMDYSNEEKGFSLFTRGIPGHQVENGKVYLTLLRSVDLLSHGDKGPIIPVMDALEVNREYEYEFAFMLHKGDWREAKVWAKALSFVDPPISMQIREVKAKGELPGDKYSFLSLTDNAILTCLKRSEDGRHVVARFYEASGQASNVKLSFFRRPRQILKSNITEEKEEPGSLEMELRPYQIVTLKLALPM